MRIFLCGQKAFGAAALQACLAAGHQVAGVSSPHGPDALTIASGEVDGGCLWMPTGDLDARRLVDIDVILAAHCHDYIGPAIRARARLGAVGYHPSLLPRHRGKDAVAWAIRMGDAITGGSVYWLDDTVDGGDIAAQDWCFVRPGDTASELWRRELFPMGLRLIRRVLKDFSERVPTRIPQDDSLATWEPALHGAPRLARNRTDVDARAEARTLTA